MVPRKLVEGSPRTESAITACVRADLKGMNPEGRAYKIEIHMQECSKDFSNSVYRETAGMHLYFTDETEERERRAVRSIRLAAKRIASSSRVGPKKEAIQTPL